jgi:hypothetical protein
MHASVIGNHEVKKPLRRTNRRWEDNIKCIIKKHGVRVWTGLNWLRISFRGRIF